MKTFKGLLIFIAVAAVLVGGILIGIGIKNQDFAKTYGEVIDSIYEPKEEFNDISLSGDITDFVILKSDEEKVRITCHETEKVYSTVNVSDNTLYIKQKDTRAWYEKIVWVTNPFSKPLTVTVYLPNKEYNKLKLELSVGDFELSDFSFEDVNVKTSTGEIKVSNLNVKNTLTLTTSTGDIHVDNVTAKEGTIKTSTGSEILNNVIATDKLSLKASTGDIKFTCIDSKSISLKTSTGDIKGDILTPKTFITHGRDEVRVPQTTGDECTAETSLGEIYITISNN